MCMCMGVCVCVCVRKCVRASVSECVVVMDVQLFGRNSTCHFRTTTKKTVYDGHIGLRTCNAYWNPQVSNELCTVRKIYDERLSVIYIFSYDLRRASKHAYSIKTT